MRRILHVDMDAFFAAVEQQRHPEWSGRPLVIGGRGDPMRRGVVATASYEARRFGIHSAMPLRSAYHLCPQAVFAPVDFPEYVRVSTAIKDILREVTPFLEDVGIDEAYLDVSGLTTPAEQIAHDVKRRIRAATGLTCSIGIAPNKLLAKIASDLQKPDGLTVIAEDGIGARIWPLPVRKIPGVGPVTEAHLRRMGVETIGQLATVAAETLTAAFGPSRGVFLYRAAKGMDERPLVTRGEPKSRSRELTFQRDTDDWQEIARVLAALSRDVAAALKRKGCRGRTVGVKLRFSDFETHTREKTLSRATQSPDAIRRAAFDCLGRLALTKKVRLVGVRVGDLKRVDAP